MSYMLPHLRSGYAVDQAILGEEDRVVVIRFGHDGDAQCMQMDEILASVAEQVKNFAVIYLVDTAEVPDFNTMYELYDAVTIMFFFRNKHIMIDLGTGNNNKINWAMNDKQVRAAVLLTGQRGRQRVLGGKGGCWAFKLHPCGTSIIIQCCCCCCQAILSISHPHRPICTIICVLSAWNSFVLA
jgi:U5 snRNP protein, DIM1 family